MIENHRWSPKKISYSKRVLDSEHFWLIQSVSITSLSKIQQSTMSNLTGSSLHCFPLFLCFKRRGRSRLYLRRVRKVDETNILQQNFRSNINAHYKYQTVEQITRSLGAPQRLFHTFTYTRQTTSLHEWLCCIVLGLQPFLLWKFRFQCHVNRGSISHTWALRF